MRYSRGICCRQSAGAAASSWRAVLAPLVAGPAVLPAAGPSIMTSALENYINRILEPATTGICWCCGESRACTGEDRCWRGRGSGSAGVAIPGSCGARYAGAGVKDLGPTNPAPGAGTCRLYGPKVSFIFNLKKKKNPPTWLFQTFPCLYRNQLLIHPSCFPRAYTFRFGNKRNSLTSGSDGRVNLCVCFIHRLCLLFEDSKNFTDGAKIEYLPLYHLKSQLLC